MSKQDRQGARTPADLERKYDFEKSFAEIMGIAVDAQKAAKQTETKTSAELSLKVSKDDNDQIVSMLNASADKVTIKGNRLIIESTNFELTENGEIIAKSGTIGGCSIINNKLYVKAANITSGTIDKARIPILTADKIDATDLKVKAANVDDTLVASQINADGMDLKQATIGGWHLDMVDIPTGATTSIKNEYALYSDELTDTKVGSDGKSRMYTYRVYLTAKGVYVSGRYDSSGESGTPYYARKTWLDICEGG